MMIKLVRVDHRLLHGQVAFSWTKYLGTDCILIANDEVARDELRMSALRLSKPAGIKLVIKTIDDSAQALLSGITDKYSLMILLESIEDVRRLTEKVTAIRTVNLGGTKSAEGRRQISKALFVSDDDCVNLKAMIEKGIEFNVQMIPNEVSQNITNLI
ncbi:MAG: PTS sugar transporter subunit IIB [Spirochaetaceae bacterium]|nr:PTS sugar transporter subunit IIB [Spirochaetaceae bacterium]